MTPLNRGWMRAALLAAATAAGFVVVPRLFSQEPRSDEAVIREQLPGYPLKTCVVGGEELGKMGEPVNHVHEGRLVRFCCPNCLKEFRKDPAKYLAKIDRAAKGARHEGHTAEGPHAAHAGHEAGELPTVGPPSGKAAADPAAGSHKPIWYCPMDPEFTSDRPANCPKCNMPMVPLEDDSEASPVAKHAIIKIPPMRQQLIGVRWGRSELRAVRKTIRAGGRVDLNERSLHVVNLRFGGWIEKLIVSATGDTVRRGDPLFEMYSPEALEAQRSYLLALEAAETPRGDGASGPRAASDGLLKAARDRLLLWGFTGEDLAALDPKKSIPARVTIRAPGDGVVLRRNAVQGASVEAGRDLYEIADLSTVWVHADVFEYELADMKPGMEAEVRLSALPGEAATGTVIFVSPTLNEGTRTARVRIEVPNPDGRLKPGMYAQVSLAADLGTQIVVEEDAVFDTGLRQLVFVGGPGDRFVPREVVLGPRFDGIAVVLKGLLAGEKVVTSANFLIDSESQLGEVRRQHRAGAAESPGAPAAEPAHGGHAH